MKEISVYLDNAATTKMRDNVLKTMLPYLTDCYGNASTIYSLGRQAQIALTNARETVAQVIGASGREVFFTSGGSESNNWAISSITKELQKQGKNHIITSAFEHPSVLNTVKALQKEGFDITFLPVYENGIVNINDVSKALRKETALVSVMMVNNEIGTIQPIEKIAKLCQANNTLLHTDAVQAVGHLLIDVKKLDVDMLSLSGHKIHGPKGIGALFIKQGLRISPYIYGGEQEMGKRAGTENIAAIVGLAEAIKSIYIDFDTKMKKQRQLQDRLITEMTTMPGISLNGDRTYRTSNNVNLMFEKIDGESLVLLLDQEGIAVSTGSACTSGSIGASHVLTAMGLSEKEALSSIRITMSEFTTQAEIEQFIASVKKILANRK